MTDELKKVEARIKKKHRFGWTPKYEEEFRTDLNQTVFASVACMAFEDLDWEVVYQDATSVEAKRIGSSGKRREKITVSFSFGKVSVKSVSLESQIWDNGENAFSKGKVPQRFGAHIC